MTNYIWKNCKTASLNSRLAPSLLALSTVLCICAPSSGATVNTKKTKTSVPVNSPLPQQNAPDIDPQKVIQESTDRIQQNSADAEAYENRGNAYYKLEQFDQALNDLNEAIRLDPNRATAYVGRGFTNYSLKKYQEALQDCNEAIKLDPNLAAAYTCRGNVYSKLEKYQQSQADINKALSLQHNDSGSLLSSSMNKYALKDYRGAAADAGAAIARNPKDPTGWDNRGLAEHQLKEYQAAIKDFDVAMSLRPQEAKYICHRGISYAEMGKLDLAIKDFDAAISLKSDYALAFYDRALCELMNHEYEKAAKDMQDAIKYDPHYALAIYELPLNPLKGGHPHQISQPEEYYYRACSYILMIKNRPALDDLHKYLEMTGWKGELAQSAVILSYLGYAHNNQFDQAQGILNEASTNVDTSQWPFPVIRYLKKEISPADLLAQASDDDKLTDAHAYIGINEMLTGGNHEEAVQQMEWAKHSGNGKLVSYSLAVKEIEKIQFAKHRDTERN